VGDENVSKSAFASIITTIIIHHIHFTVTRKATSPLNWPPWNSKQQKENC